MENGVTDRLWDKDVQEFIEACKAKHLGDVRLGYTVMEDGRKLLSVAAVYRSSRRGPMPVGYRWVHRGRGGWLPFVFLGTAASLPPLQKSLVRRAVWSQGLWRERKEASEALAAVGHIFFKAHAVRQGLDAEHLKQYPDDLERVQVMTLQTLNDLAFLYSSSGSGRTKPLPRSAQEGPAAEPQL